MALFGLPVIHHHHLGRRRRLPVGPFSDDCQKSLFILYSNVCLHFWSMTYKGRPHALHAGSDFVLQQVAHV